MQVILFDIDGTLILTGGAGQRAFARTFAEEFGVPEISAIVTFAGRSDRAIAYDLMLAHDIEPSDANWRKFREGYLARLPEALQELRGHVLPGVLSLLDRLAELPVQVGLLTGNIRAGAEQKLAYYDLWRRFAFGGFGDDYLDRNDIAVAALAAARARVGGNGRSAVSGSTTIVIGDTPNDIRCARAIGAKAVAVATGLTAASELASEEPDLVVENLEDSEAFIDWLAPRS